MTFNHVTEEQLLSVAEKLVKAYGHQNHWVFFGQMGAGKTTLIKAICKQLGVITPVGSPSFSLVNEYETESGETLYHFDFYRIEEEEEAYEYGYEEYFYSGNRCFIEWPERIPNLLPKSFLKVSLSIVGQQRAISASLIEEGG